MALQQSPYLHGGLGLGFQPVMAGSEITGQVGMPSISPLGGAGLDAATLLALSGDYLPTAAAKAEHDARLAAYNKQRAETAASGVQVTRPVDMAPDPKYANRSRISFDPRTAPAPQPVYPSAVAPYAPPRPSVPQAAVQGLQQAAPQGMASQEQTLETWKPRRQGTVQSSSTIQDYSKQNRPVQGLRQAY